jgi:hypothetical protein
MLEGGNKDDELIETNEEIYWKKVIIFLIFLNFKFFFLF